MVNILMPYNEGWRCAPHMGRDLHFLATLIFSQTVFPDKSKLLSLLRVNLFCLTAATISYHCDCKISCRSPSCCVPCYLFQKITLLLSRSGTGCKLGGRNHRHKTTGRRNEASNHQHPFKQDLRTRSKWKQKYIYVYWCYI